MDAQQFAYWLQGFAELNEAPPTPEQWQSIREHLGTVFVKVTPPLGGLGRPYPNMAPVDPRWGLKPLQAECVVGSSGGATTTC